MTGYPDPPKHISDRQFAGQDVSEPEAGNKKQVMFVCER